MWFGCRRDINETTSKVLYLLDTWALRPDEKNEIEMITTGKNENINQGFTVQKYRRWKQQIGNCWGRNIILQSGRRISWGKSISRELCQRNVHNSEKITQKCNHPWTMPTIDHSRDASALFKLPTYSKYFKWMQIVTVNALNEQNYLLCHNQNIWEINLNFEPSRIVRSILK